MNKGELCFCKGVEAAAKVKEYAPEENKQAFEYSVCGNDPRACKFFMAKGRQRPKPAPFDRKCIRCGEYAQARMCGKGANEGKFFRKCDCGRFSWCDPNEPCERDFNVA